MGSAEVSRQPAFVNSTALRLSGFFTFYFAQGVPIGLLSIALPAWLAGQGMGAADIATFVAITGIPWGVKLVAGPFMDRFSFPAMGWRRPWVMFAQAGLTLSVLSMGVLSDPVGQFWSVIAIGFVINCFGALQDVAVDGMAIEVLPVDERGRANAFMAAGQVAGFSAFGALNGYLLSRFGLGVTSVVSALTVALVFVFIALIRERPGERLLPWSPGQATPLPHRLEVSLLGILKDLLKVVLLPMSLILIVVEFFLRASAGIGLSIMPIVAVQDMGFSSENYAYWVGMLGGVSAFVGLAFGPVIDRFGAKRMLFLGLLLQGLVTGMFALLEAFWSNTTLVLTLYTATQIFSQLVLVSVFAVFMGICWKRVAATQFSVYMSLANLSRSIGAGLFAVVAVDVSNGEAIFMMAGLLLTAAVLLLWFNEDKAMERIASLDA